MLAKKRCPPSSTGVAPRMSRTKVGGRGLSCAAHLTRDRRDAVPPVPKKRTLCLARVLRSLWEDTLQFENGISKETRAHQTHM
jgi:hypothetical protein